MQANSAKGGSPNGKDRQGVGEMFFPVNFERLSNPRLSSPRAYE